MARIKVKLFASIREAAGTSELDMEICLPLTISDLLEQLKSQSTGLTRVLSEQAVLVAVNQQISELSQQLQDDDELAIFPPVTGG